MNSWPGPPSLASKSEAIQSVPKGSVKVEQMPASKANIAERRKPNHLACPVICEWIRCIKGTKTASRGFYHINAVDTVTTGKWWGAWKVFSGRHRFLCWMPCCISFPFRFEAFIRRIVLRWSTDTD